jgi:hypothetical protein
MVAFGYKHVSWTRYDSGTLIYQAVSLAERKRQIEVQYPVP